MINTYFKKIQLVIEKKGSGAVTMHILKMILSNPLKQNLVRTLTPAATHTCMIMNLKGNESCVLFISWMANSCYLSV